MTIKGKIQRLSENDLRDMVVIPLMRALGCSNIRKWHGRSEKGKDVLYQKENTFGDLVYGGILLKACGINKHRLTTSVRTQCVEAIRESFPDPNYPGNTVKIYELMIMTSRNITEDVRDYIQKNVRTDLPSVEIVDGDRLSHLIDKIILDSNRKCDQEHIYDFKIKTFQEFCERYHNQTYYRKDIERPIIKNKITKISEGEEIK